MKFKDYYETFGLPREATQDEIKRAYRKLARKYHPDVSKAADAEARFKELGEAYAVLKDPEKRAAYDQMGSQWKAGQDFQPPPGWDEGFEFSGRGADDDLDQSDFFEALFGRQARGGRQTGMPARGRDHHARVMIDLEDAYRGAQRAISYVPPPSRIAIVVFMRASASSESVSPPIGLRCAINEPAIRICAQTRSP